MSSTRLFTRPLSIDDFVTRFIEVAAATFQGKAVNFNVNTNIPALAVNVQGAASGSLPTQSHVSQLMEAAKDRSFITCTSAAVSEHQDGNHRLQYGVDNNVIGWFEVTTSNRDLALRMVAELEQRFHVSSYVDLVGTVSPTKVFEAGLQHRERAVADLENAVGKLGDLLGQIATKQAETITRIQKEADESYRAKLTEVEADDRGRRSRFDEEKAAFEGHLVRKNEEIEEARRKLEADRKEYETRESKWVRRKLQTDINTHLSALEQLTLSDATQKKRWAVHIAVWGVLAVSGTAGSFIGWKLYSSPAWPLVGPLAAMTLTFFGTLVYYIKWNDQWFRQHAEEELAAKRYKADVVRAGWIAELVSEWSTDGRKRFPADLIAAYTRNLFQGISGGREVEHPFDQIGSLVKRAKELKIGKGHLSLKAGDDSPSDKS